MLLHGIKLEHGNFFLLQLEKVINKTKIWNREDKKLKIEVLKEFFRKHLVETEWTCKNKELKVSEIEDLSGEV